MFGLDKETIEMIVKILKENKKVEKIVIFGSRATGKHKNNSDIDIALFGDLDFRDISRLKGMLEESSCIYKVDLVHYEKIENKELKNNIDLDGKEL